MKRVGGIGDLDFVRKCQVTFSARGISLRYRSRVWHGTTCGPVRWDGRAWHAEKKHWQSATNSVELRHELGAGWCSVGTWSASAPPAADDRSHRPAERCAHLVANRTRYCLVRTGRGAGRDREAAAADPAAAARPIRPPLGEARP